MSTSSLLNTVAIVFLAVVVMAKPAPRDTATGSGGETTAGEIPLAPEPPPTTDVVRVPVADADPAAIGPHTPSAPPGADTAVCKCGGSNRGVCYCLQNRITCRCNSAKGSVWEMANGRAVRKTGEYADPRVTAPMSPVRTVSAETGYAVQQHSDGRWYWNDGEQWRWTSARPHEGQAFAASGKRFIYRAGRMQAAPPRMVVEIKPLQQRSLGHYETRCFGGYCRQVWVPH